MVILFKDVNGESSLLFDGNSNKLMLFNKNGKIIDFFDAHNNTTEKSQGKWENGIYRVESYTRNTTNKHPGMFEKNGIPYDSRNGRYGKYGTIVAEPFTQTDGKYRIGMAIHAGRTYLNFMERVTDGCIRLDSGFDMSRIVKFIKNDPLDYLLIINNKERQGMSNGVVTVGDPELLSYWNDNNQQWINVNENP